MKNTTYQQEIRFNVPPIRVYEALMEQEQHAAFTGSEVTIEDSEGSEFSVFDGYITGRNLKLIPGKLIHQTWVAVEEEWPEGHESEVTFEFFEEGEGTLLRFTHSEVPEELEDRLKKGWDEYYWEAMEVYFDESHQDN